VGDYCFVIRVKKVKVGFTATYVKSTTL